MTALEHPPHEQVADLHAGLLPAEEAMGVNAHVAGCAECRALRSELAGVTALLAAVGAAGEPMPVDVADALYGALLAEAGGSHVAPHGGGSPLSMRRRVPRWLAGAAAAIVLTSAGIAAWQALPQAGSDADSSAGSADRQSSAEAGADAPPRGGNAGAGHHTTSSSADDQGTHSGWLSVAPAGVPAAARRLAADGQSRALHLGPCATPAGPDRYEVIGWWGRLAVLTVRPATRTAAVLDCATARRVLFTAGY